jgi:hypothetical protein
MNKKLMALFFILILTLSLTFTDSAATVKTASYEYAWFPISTINITQIAYESYSHENSNHIDCVGETYAFAPFTGKIVNVSESYGVTLFQSVNKVYYPDGTLDYMTVQFMHGSNFSEWKSKMDNGTIIPQGNNFYKIGGIGSGGESVYPNHYDIGIYKGKTSSFTSFFSSFGNTYAFKAFYINPNKTTSIINKGVVESGNSVYNNTPTNWSGLWVNLVSSNIINIRITYKLYDDVNTKWVPMEQNASPFRSSHLSYRSFTL